MKKTALILLLILSTAHCSLLRKKVSPYPTGVIFPLDKAAEVAYAGEIIGPAQRDADSVYFSTRKGEVYRIDSHKQEISWTFRVQESLDSPVYLSEKRIYVCSLNGTLYCLDKEGQCLWNKEVGEKVTSGVEEAHGRVYFGTKSGVCFCLDPVSGEEIWKFAAGVTVRPTPFVWKELILFRCGDGNIHFLDKKGNSAGSYASDAPVQSPLAGDGDFLYFATQDGMFRCVDVQRHREKWRIKSGSPVYSPPVVHKDKVFFLGWNGVLYCLKKKNGTLLWWSMASSRSAFPLEIVEDKIIAASLSPEIVCFNIMTGENQGTYTAPGEMRSNPVWLSPHLLVNLYDHSTDEGTVIFLMKKVSVELSSSKKPPQKPAEEIVLSAKEAGFHLPEYTFFLTRFVRWELYPDLLVLVPAEEKAVAQEKSEENKWAWIPAEEGIYLIGVAVTDAKETAETETLFEIREEETKSDDKKQKRRTKDGER
jgi:outer membrane protein assembly factor BamB